MDFKFPRKFLSKDSVAFPQEKKKQFLTVILIIIIIVTLIIIYFGWFRPPSPTPPPQPTTISLALPLENIINKIDFDINFLKSPLLEKLKTYGEWPLKIEEKGRSNPFLPY